MSEKLYGVDQFYPGDFAPILTGVYSKLVWILLIVLLSCLEYECKPDRIRYMHSEAHVPEHPGNILSGCLNLQSYLRFQIQISGFKCIQCTLCVFDLKAFTNISFFIHCCNIYATFMYIQTNIDSNHLLCGVWEFRVRDNSTAFYSPLLQGTMSRRRAANL